MQVPVSSKGGPPTVATPTSGGVLGKAKAKQGVLPAFAEILAGQSGEIGKAGHDLIPDLAVQNDTGKELEDRGQQVEMPVFALHTPEGLFPNAFSVKSHLETNAAPPRRGDTVKAVTGEKRKAGISKISTSGIISSKPSDSTPESYQNLAPAHVPVPLSAALSVTSIGQKSDPKVFSLSLLKTGSPAGALSAHGPSPALLDQPTKRPEEGGASGAASTAENEASVQTKVDPLLAPVVSAAQSDIGFRQQSPSAPPAEGISEQIRSLLPHEQNGNSAHAAPVAMDSVPIQPVSVTSEQDLISHAASVKTKMTPKSSSEDSRVTLNTVTPIGSVTAPHGVAPAGASLAAGNSGSSNSGAQLPAEGKSQAASSGDPFQHLDSGELPASLLHANAHEVSVGVRDPSLGWVEIQTQSSAGHVSASLTAVSAEAHANLAAEVPALTQYLADRNVHVHAIGISTQSGTGGGGQSQTGSGYAQEQSSQGKTYPLEIAQSLQGNSEDEGLLNVGHSSYISVHA